MDTPRWVRTDSGGFADFPVTGHTPQSLGTLPQLVPVVSAPSEMRCGHFPVDVHSPQRGGGAERRLELLLQGKSPKSFSGVFFFLGKSSCSILWLPPYKEGPVLSHSPSLQLSWGLSRSGLHMGELSTLPSQHPQSLWVYHFVPIPLPVTSSNQVSHSVARALFGRGGIP